MQGLPQACCRSTFASSLQQDVAHRASSQPVLREAASCQALSTASLPCCSCWALLRCDQIRAAHHSNRADKMSSKMPRKAGHVRRGAAEPAGQWESQEHGKGSGDCRGQKCLLGHCMAVKGSGQYDPACNAVKTCYTTSEGTYMNLMLVWFMNCIRRYTGGF